MALNDWEGEPVLSGTWFYDGYVPRRVTILARNYDAVFTMYEQEGMLDEAEAPTPLGPDGKLYFVDRSGPPLPTLEDAKRWASSQPWGPVTWDKD